MPCLYVVHYSQQADNLFSCSLFCWKMFRSSSTLRLFLSFLSQHTMCLLHKRQTQRASVQSQLLRPTTLIWPDVALYVAVLFVFECLAPFHHSGVIKFHMKEWKKNFEGYLDRHTLYYIVFEICFRSSLDRSVEPRIMQSIIRWGVQDWSSLS